MRLNCLRRSLPSQHLPTLVHGRVVPFRPRHSLRALEADYIPSVQSSTLLPEGLQHEDYSQVPWARHFGPLTEKPKPERKWAPDTYYPYISYARPFLQGLWELDKNPIWLVVDDLATAGRPLDDHCEKFTLYEPIVRSQSFEDVQAILDKRDKIVKYNTEDNIADDMDDYGHPSTPVWLIAFVLATMIKTPSAALECLSFCFNRFDAISHHLLPSFLVICMCSLVKHRILFQIPHLLDVFYDFVTQVAKVADSSLNRQARRLETPKVTRMRELVTDYQYNTLLLLLAKCPYYTALPKVTVQFLKKMEHIGARLEADTVKRLCESEFTTKELVAELEGMLRRQDPLRKALSSDMVLTLAKFYTRGRLRNAHLVKAAEQFERTMQINAAKHLKYYVRTFRDAVAGLDYLHSLEEGKSESIVVPPHLDPGRRSLPKGTEVSFPAHCRSISSTPTLQSSLQDLTKEQTRDIFLSLLQSAAYSFKTISAETLYSMFTITRDTYGDNKYLETIVLKGLILRRAWDLASKVWNDWQAVIDDLADHLNNNSTENDDVYDGKWTVRESFFWSSSREEDWILKRLKDLYIDDVGLARGIHAVVAMNPKNLLEGFTVMDRYAIKADNSTGELLELKSTIVVPDSVRKIQLTPYVVNNFMTLAVQHRRPDIVFRLWEKMTDYYFCEANLSSLVVLIRAARMAASLQVALLRFIPQWLKGDYFYEPREIFSFSDEIKAMLAPGYRPSFLWHGEYPWRIVRHIFREELMLRNWPDLRYVEIPGSPCDEGGGFQTLVDVRANRRLLSLWTKMPHQYPHIMPNQTTFRQYIFLLGTVRRAEEIPEVLAWMKALDITPTRETLAIALAFWLGIDRRVKLDEPGNLSYAMFRGGYGILAIWIKEWLGESYVPKENDIVQACKRICHIQKNEQTVY